MKAKNVQKCTLPKSSGCQWINIIFFQNSLICLVLDSTQWTDGCLLSCSSAGSAQRFNFRLFVWLKHLTVLEF